MCTGSRALALSTALVGVIQSAISLAIGILAVALYKCKITPKAPEDFNSIVPVLPTIPPGITYAPDWNINFSVENITEFFKSNTLAYLTSPIYLQYFHSQQNCETENNSYWRNVTDLSMSDLTKSSSLNGFMTGYVIENALWLGCSLLLCIGAVCNNKWIYNVYNSTHIGVIFYDIVLVVIFGLDFKNYSVTLLIKTLLPSSQSQS